MISKFLKRLTILGLAFLITCISQTGIGRAYFCLDIGWMILKIIGLVLVIAFVGLIADEREGAGVFNAFIVIISAALIGVNLLLSWIISRLCGIDFYTSYVVLDFIMCLIPTKKKNE